jgi:hypothetical protein
MMARVQVDSSRASQVRLRQRITRGASRLSKRRRVYAVLAHSEINDGSKQQNSRLLLLVGPFHSHAPDLPMRQEQKGGQSVEAAADDED